jgi:predicted DNA-binding transcriptional regulator AlpA
MGSSSLLYSNLFCKTCRKQAAFLPIHLAVILTGNSRRTLYRWMERGWIHWRELPNGRRLLCQESLVTHNDPRWHKVAHFDSVFVRDSS